MMTLRVIWLLVLLLPVGMSGCLEAAVELAELANDMAEQFDCPDTPETLGEERGRAVAPMPLADAMDVRESGQARISIDQNFTIMTWTLGRLGVGTPNVAYDARFGLVAPGGETVWSDGNDGLAEGFSSSVEVANLPPGEYRMTWDVRGAGTEYSFHVAQSPCVNMAAFV